MYYAKRVFVAFVLLTATIFGQPPDSPPPLYKKAPKTPEEATKAMTEYHYANLAIAKNMRAALDAARIEAEELISGVAKEKTLVEGDVKLTRPQKNELKARLAKLPSKIDDAWYGLRRADVSYFQQMSSYYYQHYLSSQVNKPFTGLLNLMKWYNSSGDFGLQIELGRAETKFGRDDLLDIQIKRQLYIIENALNNMNNGEEEDDVQFVSAVVDECPPPDDDIDEEWIYDVLMQLSPVLASLSNIGIEIINDAISDDLYDAMMMACLANDTQTPVAPEEYSEALGLPLGVDD